MAAGIDGIDIYKVRDGHLFFWKTYGPKEIGFPSINVVDIDSSEEGDKLYILDSAKGFTYLNIDIIENPV